MGMGLLEYADKEKQKLNDYYNSPEWAKKRNERLKLDGYKCARCGFTRALQVHHINYDRLFNEDVSTDLVTLCKKCHNEIESQKKTINPIKKPIEHHSVYLAGKIRHNGWRTGICRYRGVPYNPEEIGKDYEEKINDFLTITGPFFISCDHGCYHGEGQHGIGASDGGCMGDYFSRKDVLNICKSQILRAEIVFAYIDCRDCYGTIAEIGFAHAYGKDIFISFSNFGLQDDMWFINEMQQNTGIASQEWIEKQIVSRLPQF